MFNIDKKIWNSSYLLMIFGFVLVILVGTFLLMLPISSSSGEMTPFTTALFTSTSATCVTGLVVVDTGTYFSEFGHSVILMLIQIGGIGIIAFLMLFIRLKDGKIGLRERLHINEVYSSSTEKSGIEFIKWVFIITFATEFVGAVLLSIKFIPQYGFVKGVFYSLFHSISAFNNAGFDLFGGYSSLTSYVGSVYIIIVIMILITIGGLGFITIIDLIMHKRNNKKMLLTTKIVCSVTIILFVVGTLIFAIMEWKGISFAQLSSVEKIFNSMFLSVTPRTAGFNTVNMTLLTTGSALLVILLMYIGASPSSTGGGLKTTTMVIPILCIISIFKGKEDIEIFGRRISKKLLLKSLCVISISVFISFVALIVLSFTENVELKALIFEVASAINTVGLSLGVTPNLSTCGRYVIILLMFIGRVGPITVLMSLSLKNKKTGSIKLVKEDVLIG